MRAGVVIAVIAALAGLLLSGCSSTGDMQDSWNVKAGDPLPAFSLKTADGKAFTNADLQGKVALVAIWATWCPPCRAELPVLDEKIFKKLKDSGVTVVGVNAGEEAAAVQDFAKKAGITFPLLADPESSFSTSVGGQYLPRSLLIDRQGKIHTLHAGFDPAHADALVKEVQDLASVK